MVAMYVLGALITVGFFVLLGLLLFYQIPDNNNDVLYLAIGSLISAFSMVVGYFYGSSAGSAHKTDIIDKNKNGLNI